MSETVIYRRIRRPDPALIERLRRIPVADLHDEMHAVDRRTRLMSPAMRPLLPHSRFVGPAVTAFNTPGDNLMMHTALYLAQAGDVLVMSNGGVPYGALWGGNAAIQAKRIGVVGLVADGPVRDTEGIRGQGFPVFSTSVSATRPTKAMPGSVNVPIQCAGVIVRPGDLIAADEDGVIVIPVEQAERLADAALARIGRDKAMHAAIERGSTLFQELGGEAALAKLGAVIHDTEWPGP